MLFSGSSDRDYHPVIVTAYRKRVNQLMAAPDERTFYAQKGMRYEKLGGDRSHQRSIRLNEQFRLIVELDSSGPEKVLWIVRIEDYH